MLPDFLKTKEKIQKMLDYTYRQAISGHLGPIAGVPKSILFEGNKSIVNHEDGSVSETKPEEISIKLQINLAEVETMNHEKVLEKIDQFASIMAEKHAKLFYAKVDETVEEAGNVVSADGKPFSMDLFFEVLEKIPRDFDEEGNPSELMCPVNPKLFPSVAKVIEQAKTDPEMDKRINDIMERKREEWRVRESNRKLVG